MFRLVLFTTSVQFQKCAQLYTQSMPKCGKDVRSVNNGETVYLCVSSILAVSNCRRITGLGQ